MGNKKLSRSLLQYDVITLIMIYIIVFLMFEVLIKNLLVNYKVDSLNENLVSLQLDFFDAVTSLEEKSILSYDEYIRNIIDYSKRSTLSRLKYDNSIVAIVFPDEYGLTTFGSKNKFDRVLNKDSYGLIHRVLFNGDSNSKYSSNKGSKNIKKRDKYIELNADSSEYIAIAQISTKGIKSGLERNSDEDIYPIFIVGDKRGDFFYIINLAEIIFIFWLTVVFLILGTFKFLATKRSTVQIYEFSNMLNEESENITQKGIVGGSLRKIETEFVEIENLNTASASLSNSLKELRRIVQGTTTEEFFIGTITNNKSITEQHDVFVTVMFLDIKGFTGISEKHKSNAMVIGNTIFSHVGKIIKEHGGQIRKLLGDAALITFKNPPDTGSNSALNAVSAGIRILNDVSTICDKLNELFNPEKSSDLMIDFNFRIGLDSGTIGEGLYGTEDNFEYGIIGDAVNTASRFESLNKQYNTNILVSDNTYNELISVIVSIYGIKNEAKSIETKIADTLKVRWFCVDTARPKGKIKPNKIYTLSYLQKDNLRLLGQGECFNIEIFGGFSELLERFHQSIQLWKKTVEPESDAALVNAALVNAKKEWSNIAKHFAQYMIDKNFKVAEPFLKLILNYQEFNRLQADYEGWKDREIYDLKIPSSDWISNPYGCRELDK